MLDLLRNAAKSWVAKLLLLLLVASFAVWGVSGSIMGAADNAVITVGDTTVTPNEFSLAFNRQVAAVSRQLGQRISTEQAKTFGVPEQVYSQLVAGAVLDEQAREMNLGLSDNRLAQLIAEDPAFHDFNGRFVRANFQRVLQSVGMSEDEYIRSRSNVAVRAQIVEAVADGFEAPDAMVAALAQYRNESRDVDYIFLTSDILEPIAAPDEATLKAYYEDNKADYMAPEYRKIAYVRLTPEDIADPAAISEEAVRQDYEAHLDSYRVEEKRTLDQLTFTDAAAAQAAAERLESGGESFDTIATEQGKSAADLRIGTFTRKSAPSQAIAEAAFAVTEEGGTTGVVDGPFGPVILRVAEIEPESARTFEEVAPELRKEMALAEASQQILDVHDAYEDARAGGMTLRKAAASQGLEANTIEAVDRAGRAPDGTVIADIPQSRELLQEAFNAEEGVELPPIDMGSDGFIWFEVVEIIPERQKPFEEVRDQVASDWIAARTEEALGARASELAERLEQGATLETIAGELGLAVESKYSINRDSSDAVFGEAAVSAAFGGPDGHSGVVSDVSGDNRILFKVKSVSGAGDLNADAVPEAEREQLARQMTDDILNQMISQLRDKYGVRINQDLAERAMTF